MSARDTALSALIACRRQHAWSDGVLKEYTARDRLDRRDAALASRLCYGVLQNRMLLDEWLSRFVKGRLRDLQPVVLDILRLGAYQLTMMDKIPPSAAVNEAVGQTRRLANGKAANLVNAVLRNMDRSRVKLTLPEDLSVRYSHPPQLVALLAESLPPEKLEPFLACDNQAPATYVQVNTLRATEAAVCSALEHEGYQCRSHLWMADCLQIMGGSIDQSRPFAEGQVYAQDPAAKLAALCAGLEPGMRVLDCCSAPGGKSFAAAIAMEDKGQIVSCDIHPHKIALIEKGARRLGLQCIRPMLADATQYRPDWAAAFDVVLADAPCSGLGVIRKKPDIRYRELSQTEALPALQKKILDNQARYVRPGGTLMYSTCTVLRREHEAVAEAFLQTHPDFAPAPLALPASMGEDQCGRKTLLPCDDDADGFFLCRFRRKL